MPWDCVSHVMLTVLMAAPVPAMGLVTVLVDHVMWFFTTPLALFA